MTSTYSYCPEFTGSFAFLSGQKVQEDYWKRGTEDDMMQLTVKQSGI